MVSKRSPVTLPRFGKLRVVRHIALYIGLVWFSPFARAGEEYAPSEVVVRFAPDTIDLSETGTIPFSPQYVTSEAVRSILLSIGASALETFCDGWRHIDQREPILDINGVPLGLPLVDFSDVYRVRYSTSASPIAVSASLNELEAVYYAMPNYIVRGLSCTCATGAEDIDDEHYPSTSNEPGQWALHNPGEFSDAEVIAEEDIDINLPEAWDIFSAAVTKARVGVLDEGFDIDHEDLTGAIDRSDSRCSGSPPCDIGGGNRDHGTAVAAIVGAKANNGCVGGSCTGVAGVIGHPSADDSLLVPIRVAAPSNQAFLTNLADAIEYASDSLGLAIANISLTSMGGATGPVTEALRNGFLLGTLFVVAGGNTETEGDSAPQDSDRFGFGVGAIGIDGTHTAGYATGRHIDVVAPAGYSSTGSSHQSWTAKADDQYGAFPATSAAAPIIAGAASLVLSYSQSLTNEDLIEVLARTRATL